MLLLFFFIPFWDKYASSLIPFFFAAEPEQSEEVEAETSEATPEEETKAVEKETKKVGLRESFVPVGGTIVGTDGSIMVNDFVSMEIANTHPNCRCSLNYKVVQWQN